MTILDPIGKQRRLSLYWSVLLLGVAFAGLYSATLTEVHTYDALSYILDVDRKPWPELFHPHHLLYGPLGAVIRAIATALGWQGSVEIWLQLVNAVAGAIGVSFLFVICRSVTGSGIAALAATLWVGFSYAYWYYAVEVEVYTLAAVALIGVLWLLFKMAQQPTMHVSIWLGITQGLAVLGHQTNVLLSVPIFLTIALAVTNRLRRLRLFISYLIPLLMVVGSAYLWVAIGVSGMRCWEDIWLWLTDYAQTGFWGGAIDGAKFIGLLKGWSATLAFFGGGVIGLASIGLLVAGRGGVARLPLPLRAGIVGWLGVYGLFFLWWEPDNIEFWIACLPPLALLLSAALTVRWIGWVGLLLSLSLLSLNLPAIIERGAAERDLQQRIAAALAEISQPGDLIIVPDGVLELYLPHYWQHDNVYGLNQAMTASNSDWKAACARIQQRIEVTLTAGYAVIIADEAQRPSPAPPDQPPTPAERFGLNAETVASCYAPVQGMLRLAPLPTDLPVYRLIPRANEVAVSEGWDFRQGRWGWQVGGVEFDTLIKVGWHMIPSLDPMLISPPLLLTTADIEAIEVRLATTTTNRDAQIFVLDPAGQTAEDYSLRFVLTGMEMTTYRLSFDEIRERLTQIGGLRFDPVALGDGGAVLVESIRLIRR
ncbi:glycosyltransferase family 39 protein [Chloroflexus sp.]|uniref:glycosyltransferase family 39 protein n=1 Tax=Chloroflexus sp. TaxID=1904827 RepID=UPI002ADD697D|nr:glycosyltransferase family 39 protein [Chloroflexus sp.]